MAEKRTRIVLAYDRNTCTDEDREMLFKISPYIDVVKVGLQAMTAEIYDDHYNGTSVATVVRAYARDELNVDVMWDMKLNDIGNTVFEALRAIVGRGDTLFTTVHASMSDTALLGIADICRGTATIPLAVTVLTDIGYGECKQRFGDTPEKTVLKFAQKARACGIAGIVCSPKDLPYLKSKGALEDILVVTPGVRSDGVSNNDQKRVMTPGEAARAGADYVVIGREIMSAKNPVNVAISIRQRLDAIATQA